MTKEIALSNPSYKLEIYPTYKKNHFELPTKAKEGSSNEIIQKLAQTALMEFASGMAMTGIGCLFVTSPVGAAVLVLHTFQIVAANTCIHAVQLGCTSKMNTLADKSSKGYQRYHVVCDMISGLRQILFSTIHLYTLGIVLHEAGHALAASTLYKNADVKIVVLPLEGGYTQYDNSTLSKIGSIFGKSISRFITVAGGPLASVATATAHIAIAHEMEKKGGDDHLYPFMIGYMETCTLAGYALSGLWSDMPGHDFANLAKFGIHPFLSLAFIIGVPVAVKKALKDMDKKKAKIGKGEN